MRRKLAYILLSSALIFAGAATIGSAITSMDTDLTYGAGRELVFKISEHGTTYNGVDPDNYIQDDGYQAVDAVSEEMERRLETWGVNSTVIKEGYNTIKVQIRAQDADEVEYNYITRYLAHSGENITVAAGSTDEEIVSGAPSYDVFTENRLIEGNTADIRYVNDIPVVTVEVNDEAAGADGPLAELINYCQENTVAPDSSTGEEGSDCYLVLWANRQEGDNFAEASDSENENYDPNMSSRLLFGENAASAWYDDSDDDLDYTRLQLVPNSSAIESGQFDESRAGAAYKAAFFYMNMLNASSYADIVGEGVGYDVTYAYYSDIAPTSEPLITAGDWHLSPTLGWTAIASLISLAVGIVVLACFYRLGALGITANVGVTLLSTMLLYAYFSSQFGIGTLVGLILVALIAAFGGVVYFAKIKEQLYEGRTLKKSHHEAMKKTFWPVFDASIIAILIGVCVYSLVPGAVGQLGLILVLGGFFSGVTNLLILRLEGWLLANDAASENKLDKIYGCDLSKIPNLLKEEKPSYFGPYATTNFAKHKKWIGGLFGALMCASIVGIATFNSLSGTPYNYGNAYDDATSLNIEYRVESGTEETLLLASVSQLQDDFLPLIEHSNDEGETYLPLATDDYSDVIFEEGNVFDSYSRIVYDVYYFEVPLINLMNEGYYRVNGNEYTSLSDALEAASVYYAGDRLDAEVSFVDIEPGLPTLESVWLGYGIGLLSAAVYFLIRFRLSRGIVANVLIAGSSLLPLAFFSLTRIPVTPIVSLGAIAIGVLGFLFCAYILDKARSLAKDSREKDKRNLEFQATCLTRSVSEGAGDIIIFALLSFFSWAFFFGIGPEAWRMTYLGILVGSLFLLLFILVLLAPLSNFLAIHFQKLENLLRHERKKTSGDDVKKKKGSEPEEAIFIGIND